jgi:hypothetical protein
MKLKGLLKESPDTIYAKVEDFDTGKVYNIWDLDKTVEIEWSDYRFEPYPFGYYEGKFLMEPQPGGTHYQLGEEFFPNDDVDRFNMDLAGRIFRKPQIISFWRYPKNIFELRRVIKDIEKVLGQKIWGKGWKIEIINENEEENILIPLETYDGKIYSKKRHKDQDQDHAISPLLKKKKGPTYDKQDKLKMEPAKWHHYKHKNIAESMKHSELRKLIREEIVKELMTGERDWQTYRRDEWDIDLIKNLYEEYFGIKLDQVYSHKNKVWLVYKEDIRRILSRYGATHHQGQNVLKNIYSILINNGYELVGGNHGY